MLRMKLALAGTLALAVTAAAAAAGPAVQHTTAGTAAANASLLTKTDLGNHWTDTATKGAGIEVACTGHVPSGKGIVETGAAASPSFSGGSTGPFIVQETSVYKTSGQASTYWKRAVNAGVVACMRQALQTITAKGIKLNIDSQGPLQVQQVSPQTAGYRVVATLSSKTNKGLKAYMDWIFVGKGNELTEIEISDFTQAVPAKYEYALALIAYNRMGKKTASGSGGSGGGSGSKSSGGSKPLTA
jgi:hypothetical protein